MKRRRARSSRPKTSDPLIGQAFEITIQTLGSNGDGVSVTCEASVTKEANVTHEQSRSHPSTEPTNEHGYVKAGGPAAPVYVEGALPGDVLTVRLTARRGQGYAAETVKVLTRAPRRDPVCPHFGACGGCRLQHVPAADYSAWKTRQIEAALASRGITDVTIRPLIEGDPAARRRLRLAFTPRRGKIALGFRERQGRDIVAIDHCPIARPEIVALFDPLRRCLAGLDMAEKGGEISITAAKNGLDLLLDTPIPPGLADREALAALAEAEDLARLAWRPDARTPSEPIAARRQPMVQFGRIPLPLPEGAFLQATEQAEAAIRDAVREAIGEATEIADLFAGTGALSLPLAGEGRWVHAVERDPAMIRSLSAAAAAAGITPKVDATARDLDAEPLTSTELERFDALIIDPPRAGAATQTRAIAAASIPKKIAMVSCNPRTFARDARTLIDAGHRLTWVQPIDAFLYAAEIELVAAFQPAIPS